MAYLPKSKVSILRTEGGEFLKKKNNAPYKGQYIESSNGKYYAGADTFDLKEELIKKTLNTSITFGKNRNTFKYNALKPNRKKQFSKLQSVPTFKNKPTEKDYEKFKFIRYFTRKVNSVFGYFEISYDTYKLLKSKNSKHDWRFYQCGKFEWALRGDTEQINRNTLLLLQKEWPGISRAFPFLDEFKSKDPLPIPKNQPYDPYGGKQF